MTPAQLQSALDRLGSSQRSAGRWLGIGERQVRRMVAGDSKIPEPIAILLRLMIRFGLRPEDVA